MDNLEQLKVNIDNNPLVRRELEEYVSYLVDEYMDKADYRRTKLFKEIEEIYFSFPFIQVIAENYSLCLVMLERIETGKRGRIACEIMHNMYQQFPNSIEIAENYTDLLSMCADGYDSSECKEVIELVVKISSQFPNSSEIKEHLEIIQEAYETSVEYERLSDYIELLARKVSEEPKCEELIFEYVNALTEYASYVDEEECNEIKKIVSDYCNRFVDNVAFKTSYAKINVYIIEQTDEREACRLFGEVQRIYQECKTVDVAIVYAEALYEIACLQNSKHRMVLKELRMLYNEYSDNSKIVTAFVGGLSTLAEIQTEHKAKETLLEIFSLVEKYPDNTELQGHLIDAKRNYAFTYADSVFWEKEEVKVVNTNCFAVLDTETTWNNKVMTIGVVIADKVTYQPEMFKYYIITPENKEGGMYSGAVSLPSEEVSKICSREEAIQDLYKCFAMHGVDSIYAYNMSFDKSKLPELEEYFWFDIMALAANRRYNRYIPGDAECYKSGRLKRGYSAEAVIHMLSRNYGYHESHNALFDAVDELKIMQYLRCSLENYNQMEDFRENINCVNPDDLEICEFKMGDRLYHKEFGHGLILVCPSERYYGGNYSAVVCFIEKGTKEILMPDKENIKKIL